MEFCLDALTRKRLRSWWEKYMKVSVDHINRHIRWSGWLGEMDTFGQPCWRIASLIIKGVKSVSYLVTYSGHRHLLWIPLLSHGHLEDRELIWLDRFIHHLARIINSYWWQQIISPSGLKQFLWRLWHPKRRLSRGDFDDYPPSKGKSGQDICISWLCWNINWFQI